MIKTILLLISLSVVIVYSSNQTGHNRNGKMYVCPPNFTRIGRKCYFFSKKALPWQQAFFHCQSKKSWLAVIKSEIQDRHIRKALRKQGMRPFERWLGAKYNWNQKNWVWASNGRNLTYSGFESGNTIIPGEWDCLAMDPSIKYMWTAKPCVEKKFFICQRSRKIRRQKDKLYREYVDYNRNNINEIFTPDISKNSNIYSYEKVPNELREHSLMNRSAKTKRHPTKRPKTKNRKRITFNDIHKNSTMIVKVPRYRFKNTHRESNLNDKKENQSVENIKYDIYYQEKKKNSLYPQPIVEEYSFIKK